MRTTTLSLFAALSAITLAACTVKDVDTPQLAGPSTLARTVLMTADRDTLVQDGLQEAAIRLTALVQPGQSENIRLRAQVYVDGVAQDFGTLSNKSPITPTTIFYRAPAAPTTTGGQVPTTVTIAVTPDDSGDFRAETARTIDLRLIPPGVILPVNPNLVAAFTFAPAAPQVLTTVSFNAATSTNNGSACNTACNYSWNFGDNTSGTGQTVTHQFRTVGNFQVALTVTDSRGATATQVQTISVAPGTPPTPLFTTSPEGAVGVNQNVFFNASQSTAAPGRTITNYDWAFGDGNRNSGMLITHSYEAAGSYTVHLTVTDDAGSVAHLTRALTVGNAAGPVPTASLTALPAAPTPNTPVSFNASGSRPGSGANITSYVFNWGDGTAEETHTNPLQTHVYTNAGVFIATVTVTDSLGRTASAQVSVTVQ